MENRQKKHTNLWKLTHRFTDAGAKDFNLIFFALIVGIIAGLIGAVFRLTLSYIDRFREHIFSVAGESGAFSWLLPIFIGIAGVSIALYLVRKFALETAGSGVHEIEGALDGLRPLKWRRVMPVKFIASLFSLGSGLLLGREGPTIQLGANAGQMIKETFKHPDSRTNPLASAGAAAGLASAFNAPFSGIVFVLEEMHGHFKYSFFAMAGIMVASGAADFVVRALIGPDPVIKMMVFQTPPLESIWLFILLGFLFSIIGYIFNKLLVYSLDFFGNLPKGAIYLSAVAAGLLIATVGIFYPAMIGGGYNTIRMALDESLTLQFLVILFAGRLILTIFSYGIGVPGGIFAPLLALGVVFGVLFGNITQQYFPDLVQHAGIFAVAGMAGIFASTVRAPLTGLMLAVEMTSNFELLLPLIFTTVTASLFTTLFGNQPIYTVLLMRLLEGDKTKEPDAKSS